jgi:hypothetical protein
MYYQFDSRLSMPAILFDDDRIVVAGKEYDYTQLNDIEITKAPFISTYGIMELRMEGKTVPVPFAKADLSRLRIAVQETKHIISSLKESKAAGKGTEDGRGAGQEPAKTLAVKMDPYEEMKKLKELLDLDIITQEEFARKKKELLGL